LNFLQNLLRIIFYIGEGPAGQGGSAFFKTTMTGVPIMATRYRLLLPDNPLIFQQVIPQ